MDEAIGEEQKKIEVEERCKNHLCVSFGKLDSICMKHVESL